MSLFESLQVSHVPPSLNPMRNLVGLFLFCMVVALWAYSLIAHKYPGSLLAKFDIKEVVALHVPGFGKVQRAEQVPEGTCFDLTESADFKIRAVYSGRSQGAKAFRNKNNYIVKVQGPDGNVQDFPFQSAQSKGGEDLKSEIFDRIPIIGGAIANVASFDSPPVGRWCLSVGQAGGKFIEDYIFIEVRTASLPYSSAAFAGGFFPLILLCVFFGRKPDEGKRNL